MSIKPDLLREVLAKMAETMSPVIANGPGTRLVLEFEKHQATAKLYMGDILVMHLVETIGTQSHGKDTSKN